MYKYCKETSKFLIEELEGDPPLVPWVSIDPLNPDLEQYPDYANATKIEAGTELWAQN